MSCLFLHLLRAQSLFNLVFLLFFFNLVDSQRFDTPSANLSSQWVNSADVIRSVDYPGNLTVRPILLYSSSGFGQRYACGFYKNGITGFLFGIFMVEVNSGARITSANTLPQLVWSANRNRLVGENATLQLTGDGDLLLRDEKNALVWSSNTAGRGVASLEMQGSGNLVLLDGRNGSVWQSFEHPTDVLVLGQTLKMGMRLTSSVSDTDPSEGSNFLEMGNNGTLLLLATRQPYWSRSANKESGDITPYALFTNGSILFFMTSASEKAFAVSQDQSVDSDGSVILRNLGTDPHYLKLSADGSLGVYARQSMLWSLSYSIIDGTNCGLPSSCGHYGICNNGDCSCPSSSFPGDSFNPLVSQRPSLGCRAATPLSICNSTTAAGIDQHFMELPQVDYIPLNYLGVSGVQVDTMDKCKEACMRNCSCRMAIYRGASCYSFDEVYTLRNRSYFPGNVTTIALVKAQNAMTPAPPAAAVPLVKTEKSQGSRNVILILLGVLVPLVVICILVFWGLVRRRKLRGLQKEQAEEQMLDSMLPGLPRRYTYRQLEEATGSFSEKLGQGGFGTVFLATLAHKDQVAVKRLESANQGQKEFRTEVSIIGSIQHVNLVQLRGFCADKEHRLLVYELVSNGSLDKWLFARSSSSGSFLDWEARFKIALGTARGLAYLHEECRERIIHLDIKPQNILLDQTFNAKVCDFGMSKLMKRDESSVFTTMRGTPGYLAPEWLQSSITEKADVYSYGIVLLELISGERCLDATRAESSRRHFPSWACQKFGEGEGALVEIVDRLLHCEMKQSGDKMTMLVQIALWCIQEDPGSRPSMGCIVQMLEGLLEVPDPPLATAWSLASPQGSSGTAFSSASVPDLPSTR